MCEGGVRYWTEADAFIAFVETFEPGYTAPTHDHRLPYCTLVLRGGYDESAPGYEKQLVEGSLSFHPASERHAKKMAPTWTTEFYLMVKDDEFGERLRERRAKKDPVIERLMHTALLATVRNEPEQRLSVESCLAEALDQATAHEKKRSPSWLRNAASYLWENAERSVGLSELSLVANVDRSYMARMFRRRYGMTPGEYQRNIRANKAFRSIVGTDSELGEIAALCGFSDHSHLCRNLRALYGYTPGEIRSKCPL